ncbi:MAG: hypothetical protein ACJ75T_01750 [Solirubrobacterales bacterium]
MLALPAAASAAKTYVVDSTENVTPDVGCNGGGPGECDLGEAITLANTDGEESRIEFGVSEFKVENPLPAIEAPVTVDGTSEAGDPGVEIWKNSEGFFAGLTVGGNGSLIEGIAIGGFSPGIEVVGNLNRVCNSFIGTRLDGVTPEANTEGVLVHTLASQNEIGASCDIGNVISGNDWTGVLAEGLETHIANNLIGLDAAGEPLPNGESPQPSEPAGGIIAWDEGALIGGFGEGNTIAYNKSQVEVSGFQLGGGIVVEKQNIAIRGNSIFENQGRGIFFRFLFTQSIPRIESVESVEGEGTTIAGSLEGEPEETYLVDLFGNVACDKFQTGFEEFTLAGEGEDFLGSAEVSTDALGQGEFKAEVPVVPAAMALTATGTRLTGNSSSEFSGCTLAPQPKPKPTPAPSPETKPSGGAPPILFLAPPTPENGDSVVVAPKAGTVFVTVPGGKKVKLEAGQTIPVGSIVDATRGKVTLTSINRKGETQTAVFFGGIFLVQQQEGSGLVILKLRGPLVCGKGTGSGRVAGRLERGGSKSRKLWGSGKGNFRTEGNNGSATVRGTIWLTEDRCDGTFFKVRRGVVTIRDFAANETFPLGKGKSYLAQP